jgi:hypothetical protein
MLTYADRKCKPEVIWDLANLTRMLTRMLTYADTYADRKCKPEVIWDLDRRRMLPYADTYADTYADVC